MNSKTPLFDKALDEYFSKLELDEKGGQWRTCRISGEKFYIRPEDVEFYKKIRVPLPTLSPKERTRRKLAYSNSYNLFKVTSAFSGKQVIAQYPPNTSFKIYEHQVWFSDKWDPLEYGCSYNPETSFFEQFRKLQREVPHPNLWVDTTSINSAYTNNSTHLKNCYLVFDSYQVEDSAYGTAHLNSKNVFDSFTLQNSDTCYDGFESSDLWHCFFIEYSKNCRECYFLLDCRDCEHCFGCTNLRHKKYYFFNESLTKEEYERRLAELDLGNQEVIDSVRKKFSELKKQAVYKQSHNERSINSTGEYLKDSRDCYACFYIIGGENLAYSLGSVKARDSYDTLGGVGSEFCYDTFVGEQTYGLKFSVGVDYSRDMEYCEICLNSHDCFGCVGLRNKSFCVFNQQYSEEEYWRIIDQIKMVMLKQGEYGEFFPPATSPVPYNISLATSYVGYDDVELARNYGYSVEEVPDSIYEIEGETVDSRGLPHIKDIKDEVLGKIILDREHNRKFRYIQSELAFCRTYNIPLPIHHPSERMAEKRKRFGPILFELYERPCARCGKTMHSTYATERPEKNIYCERCYLETIV